MEITRDHVRNILINVKGELEPYLDSPTLMTDGRLDSLDILELVTRLETEFSIEIDPEDILWENFESIDAIKTLIAKCKP